MEKMRLLVTDNNVDIRIDKYLSEELNHMSRSYIQKLIKENNVIVNNKIIKSNYKTNLGDTIIINIPELEPLKIEAENIPLDIIYEDKDIVVVNKEKGMVVHPAAGHYNGTLVNALLYHCRDELSGINGVLRPGIVHRIDKDTSGVLVACKNDNAHTKIAMQLKEHTITRKYNALVYNNFKLEAGIINEPIGRHPIDRKKMAVNYKNGKHAITYYRVISHLNNKINHIECQLETGRTHQIRVHMASINHPLLGDTIYGMTKDIYNISGQALHAKILGFIHPSTNKYIEFQTCLPDYFLKLIDMLS